MMEISSDLKGMDYSGQLTPSSPPPPPAKFEIEENGAGKVSFSDKINSFQPDSFTVDMERFTHLNSKDATLNSRINLQRSFSRKGEKKMNLSSADNERDNGLVASSSPRAGAALVGAAATPEKSMVLNVGTADHTVTPQGHHQITIVTGHVPTATTTTTAATTERRLGGKRFSFRRTSPSSSWTVDPRRILFFFATLSSMGTILLIYFTLSMNKMSADDNMLN